MLAEASPVRWSISIVFRRSDGIADGRPGLEGRDVGVLSPCVPFLPLEQGAVVSEEGGADGGACLGDVFSLSGDGTRASVERWRGRWCSCLLRRQAEVPR